MESCRRPPSAADSSPPADSREKVERTSPVSVQDHLTEEEEEEEEAEYKRFFAVPSPQQIMISFVDHLERAHQYFEFYDFLQNECAFIKTDSNYKHVFLDLIMKPERKTRFNKLDEETILDSIFERIRGLQANEILGTKLLRHPDFPPIPEERRLQMYREFKEWIQKLDHIPFSDPTLELINQARKGYLLHQNPQVELDKMKESHPLFYEDKFMYMFRPATQYSETTVKVLNLSNEHTDEKLKDLLSVCGEVEKIERTSSFVWSEIAHVTFKNTEAAKIAPFAMDTRLISVLRMFKSFDSKFVAENVEDVSNMHERTVAKYKDLRLCYTQRQNKLEHWSQQND